VDEGRPLGQFEDAHDGRRSAARQARRIRRRNGERRPNTPLRALEKGAQDRIAGKTRKRNCGIGAVSHDRTPSVRFRLGPVRKLPLPTGPNCVIHGFMRVSNPVQHKKKRGPPATGKTPIVALRIGPPLSSSLDAWIAEQPEPRPSRSEAIRRLLTEALGKPADAGSIAAGELEHGLDDVERKIDAMIDKLTKR
jgi:Arc/MetJ-type ribon-helix-helix transcriptional regulator